MSGSKQYDALIVGAGPAGASAAVMLARAGRRVCLLHRVPPAGRQPRPQPFVRTGETLPAASRATLGALGLWSGFLEDGHLPSPGTVAWWGAEAPTVHDSLFEPSGPAWHLDRPRFDRRLRDTAAAAGAEILQEARLVDAQFVCRPGGTGKGAHWTVALIHEGRPVTCDAHTLIVATGRARSVVLPDVVRQRLDRLIGLAACLTAPAPLASVDQRVWIEATAAGWWYSAPTPTGAWTITFFTDSDCMPSNRCAETRGLYWQQQLAQSTHTRRRTGELGLSAAAIAHAVAPGRLQTMAADSYRQLPCQGPGWFAAGDSASAWDPLSGQGTERALRCGLRVANATDALLAGADGAAVRAGYERDEERLDVQYRELRRAYYAQVRQWPGAVFWDRRAQASISSA